MIKRYYFTHILYAKKIKKIHDFHKFRIKTGIFCRIFYLLVNDVKESVLMNGTSKENIEKHNKCVP